MKIKRILSTAAAGAGITAALHAAQPTFRLESVRQPDGSLSVQADPGGYGTFTVVVDFTSWDNVALARRDTFRVDGYGEILRLHPAEPGRPAQAEYTYDWIQGDADPDDADTAFVYRLPYPGGVRAEARSLSSYEAGYMARGGSVNLHVWEFALPESETVYAARRGKVIRIEGLDMPPESQTDYAPENRIWVEHTDGTIAVYSGLEKGSALVREGQLVTPSTAIAAAGLSPGGSRAVRMEVFRYIFNPGAGPKNAGAMFLKEYIDPIFATASGDERLADGAEYLPRVNRRLINEEKPRCGLRGCNIK